MRGSLSSKLLAGAARLTELRRDESGNVMIYVTVTATLLLGIVGLVLDGSRAMITHSEAQAAADAAALAGASQLDGQTGACDRAKAEASAVANKQRFAEGGGGNITIASGSPVCLNGLPASDSTSTSGYATTSDTESRYVQVTTQQLTHQNTLLAALASNNTALIQRTATAGFRRALCAPAPVMMICDTFTWQPGILFDAWDDDGSGNKGFLAPGCNSAPCVKDTVASVTPGACITDNADPAPGNKTNKAHEGINTRFGEGSTNAYPSDTNITSYPPDNVTGTLGWDCAAYWTANHGSDGFAKPAACTSNATAITRYDVYQSERAAGKIPTAGTPSAGTPTATAERRLMYLAIIGGCPVNSAQSPSSYIKAFMIKPASGPPAAKSIIVEPIGLVTSKTDPGVLIEEVQLYR